MRTRKEIIEELSKAIIRRKEADEAIDALNEELSSFDEIPSLPVFGSGDAYYRLGSNLSPSPHIVTSLDNIHWNMFHTPGYAEAFSKRVKILAKLLHCKWYLDRDYKPDWEIRNNKFFVVYREERFAVDTVGYSDSGTIYFSTRELAERVAAWMNEHALDEVEERRC